MSSLFTVPWSKGGGGAGGGSEITLPPFSQRAEAGWVGDCNCVKLPKSGCVCCCCWWLGTVSWGWIIPHQKYQKIVPVTKLNLVTVLGLGRSGKAKKVDVPQRPSEIMANNQIGGKQLKCTQKWIICWHLNVFQRVYKAQKCILSDSGR